MKIKKIIQKYLIIPRYEKQIRELNSKIILLQDERDYLVKEKIRYKNANKKLREKLILKEVKKNGI